MNRGAVAFVVGALASIGLPAHAGDEQPRPSLVAPLTLGSPKSEVPAPILSGTRAVAVETWRQRVTADAELKQQHLATLIKKGVAGALIDPTEIHRQTISTRRLQ